MTDFSRIKCKHIEAFRRMEYEGVRNISLAFVEQRLFAKNIIVKNGHFDLSLPLQPSPLKLGQF